MYTDAAKLLYMQQKRHFVPKILKTQICRDIIAVLTAAGGFHRSGHAKKNKLNGTKMKLISFVVPCYNSQAYMKKCVDSLLVAGEDAEIIIVNDGSTDITLKIAKTYRANFPSIVRVIDKPNGGHGSGVNAGLKVAEGLYFKVVDSDDWLDKAALLKLIETIKSHISAGQSPDLYVANFVYDKPSENGKFLSHYRKQMPAGEIIGWDRVRPFHFSKMMLMHALLYKREKLIASGTVLPEHTFYVDNLFAYKPLPFMQTVCYLDLDLYHYFIGRSDQSVNIANIVRRYAQQQLVMREMTDSYTWAQIKAMPKGLKRYMWHNLMVIMVNTVFFTCAECSKERKQSLKDLWRHIKAKDAALYRKLRWFSYVSLPMLLPWRPRGWVMTKGYMYFRKKLKLG